jgi:hypothetical protein
MKAMIIGAVIGAVLSGCSLHTNRECKPTGDGYSQCISYVAVVEDAVTCEGSCKK